MEVVREYPLLHLPAPTLPSHSPSIFLYILSHYNSSCYFYSFLFSVKPDNVQLLTNFTANKTCPGSFWNFSCLVGPAKPEVFSYQLLANDVVVDKESSGMWVRLLSSSGVFTYKCLANNTVGPTISENEKNITVAGNYYTE